MQGYLKRLTDLSNRAAVTIYTQDARGLAYVGMTSGDNISLTTQKLDESVSFGSEVADPVRTRQGGGVKQNPTTAFRKGIHGQVTPRLSSSAIAVERAEQGQRDRAGEHAHDDA